MKVAIFGASGHGKVVHEILRHDKDIDVVGFLDDNPRESFNGLSVLGGTDDLETLKEKIEGIIVAIGNNRVRKEKYELAKKMGFKAHTAIHPTAFVADDARIGDGSTVCAGAIICSQARVGKNCIINTGATIDHENKIGDHAHISPGAHLGGNVTVGELSWVGIGSAVIHGISIGKSCMIGGGAAVTKDIPDNVLAVGVPAKVIRKPDKSRIKPSGEQRE